MLRLPDVTLVAVGSRHEQSEVQSTMRTEDIMFLALYVSLVVCVIGWAWSIKSAGKFLGECVTENRKLLDYCREILNSNDNLLSICSDVNDENSRIIEKYNYLLGLIQNIVTHDKGISKKDAAALMKAITEANQNICYVLIEDADKVKDKTEGQLKSIVDGMKGFYPSIVMD